MKIVFKILVITAVITAFFGRIQAQENAGEASLNWEKLAPHPRILLSDKELAKLKTDIEKNPRIKILHEKILEESRNILTRPPAERKMTGKRLLAVSREILKRVFFLSYAYRMTGDEKFAERAKEEMINTCKFSDWNPSHFLDTAEICTALGIGYDWLWNYLDEDSKNTIRTAMLEKGIVPSATNGWFLTSKNNWNQVCNAGMIYASLALFDSDEEIAKEIILRSVNSNKLAFKVYDPDGNYPEGYSYWEYGNEFQVHLLGALESAFGKNAKLYDKPGFLNSANFMLFSIGPSGNCFNFSDSGESARHFPAALPWFAAKLKDSSVLIPYANYISPEMKSASLSRNAPLAVIYGAKIDIENLETPKKNSYLGRGENPVAMFRTDWRDGEGLYLGTKGGKATVAHAHADAGTFVFDSGKTRWVSDLTGLDYNKMETRGVNLWNSSQNSQRWKLIRYGNRSHNTLTVNGKTHNVKGFASIDKIFDSPEKLGAAIDLTKVFTPDLTSAMREIYIADAQKLVAVDTLTAGKTDASVRWNICTRAKVEISEDKRSIALKYHGKTATLSLETDLPFEAKTFSTEIEDPKDEPIKGYTFTGFDITIPAEKTVVLKATLTPDK